MTTTGQLRPLTAGDDHAMLALIAACDLADIGVVDVGLEDVQDDLARPTWHGWGLDGGAGELREFRGRGLARLLLTVAFAEFHDRGYRGVTLSVDAASPTGAVRLYESVGMVQAFEVVLYELPPLAVTP